MASVSRFIPSFYTHNVMGWTCWLSRGGLQCSMGVALWGLPPSLEVVLRLALEAWLFRRTLFLRPSMWTLRTLV